MDEIKFGDILLPGDEGTQERQERTVRARFWPTMRKAMRQLPFGRDVVAAYYCATDRQTPLRVRGILLAALGYFVLPFDTVPDMLAVVGFTDDIAVLTTAFALISSHIREQHYEAADRALADEPGVAAG
ncbi:YkvA family protein [Ciceribacter thiooxidans]|uniref:YkvA family protein n=1 Tax=Ciceribacter thiooxidans TaxID=1969821 RepID=A0ABV7HTZ1_9HYPH|nr:YkvA family protein [Ciceribacter thiooxidans]MDI6838191.1 YkvA family protein [Rhizobiaceae bacterium]